ncbi:MAG TPA: alpha/beta fold hydrolase [Gaiellaceae bacterium]
MRIVLALIVIAVGLVPAASARSPRLVETCVTMAERSHVLRYRASDGVRLVGLELGRGPRGVVLAHGYGGNFCEWVGTARRLSRAGYRVLAFDVRNHGSSAPVSQEARYRIDRDVASSAALLRRRGARTIVLMGSSMGASAVIAGAAVTSPRVDGVISLSSPATFVLLDVEASARRVTSPTIFVAGEFDRDFAADARKLYDASPAADKRLIIVRDSGEHGSGLRRYRSLRRGLDAFIAAHSR